ncbi:amidoligase family protein [Luteithermobacter gelatinilyticus]|uniref:amidoligase family protein n=1 Tax=Luteithermobacter gelatinilyticus TaxID=2582913 RepID=UPI0011060FFC|nr:amidoligase family protein [Luteithermobacter gelatinilyticus]|tara:strand:+ start:15753 stop:16736 length:984 start_codon:yes stop_codon:yes gene_type:complete
MLQPPCTTNFENKPRRIGLEIEYIGLDLEESAAFIQDLFSGEIRTRHKNALEVDSEALGVFRVELDVQLLQKLAEASRKNEGREGLDLEGRLEELISPLIKTLAPNEIVTPPLPLDRLEDMEQLITVLRQKGAKGTGDSISYAFGLHLNPEVCSFEAEYILAHLQAFVLLYDWLKDQISMDFTRLASAYAGGFPAEYARLILSERYAPDLSRLIDDYLQYNPSRNRALDMLPLMACLDEARVRKVVKSELVKKRPTFHFRMPNCKIEDPSWSITVEWNRWVMVEKLAANEDLRRKMADHRIRLMDRFIDPVTSDWLVAAKNYVEGMR